MARLVTAAERRLTFSEICGLITKRNKVIVAGRPGYFPDLDEMGELLEADQFTAARPAQQIGHATIPAYVSKSIIGVLDWGMSAQDTVDHPNLIARGETVRVEISVEPGAEIAADLKARGYNVQEREGENSGLHVIVVGADALDGAADKRREGTVRSIYPGAAASN